MKESVSRDMNLSDQIKISECIRFDELALLYNSVRGALHEYNQLH